MKRLFRLIPVLALGVGLVFACESLYNNDLEILPTGTEGCNTKTVAEWCDEDCCDPCCTTRKPGCDCD